MTAKIISVVNQKGGVGKTTITMNLAGTLALRNYKVLVIDADSQQTAMRWSASASDENPFPARVIGMSEAGGKVHREAKKFIDDYDFMFIDCPRASDSPIAQSALLIADLGLIPVLPSPPDLWSSVDIKKVIEQVSVPNENIQTRLVLNQKIAGTRLGKQVHEILTDFGIPLLNTVLGRREAFKQSAAFGATVHTFGRESKEAVQEVNNLTDEILTLLNHH